MNCDSCGKKRFRKKAPYLGNICRDCSIKNDSIHKAKKKRWYAAWSERVDRSAYKKEWYLKNSEKYIIYRSENRDHYLKTQRDWKGRTGKGKFYCAKRRAQKLKATPKWSNLDLIKEFYANCPKGFEVDHIIPLQGKIVSGLHVEYNLQYLPKSENKRKGNRMLDIKTQVIGDLKNASF